MKNIINIIRLILLRLLISWWMIPALWTILWFVLWIMIGATNTNIACKSFTHILWNGEDC